jgi:hypothetical protein
MFEDRVLRRIFELWRKLSNEELNNLYSSQNTSRVIKKDKMDRKCRHGVDMKFIHFSPKILKGRDYVGDVGLDGRAILKFILEKENARI